MSDGSFASEIEANQNAAQVDSRVASLKTSVSSLDVRLRGAYITKCELTSPASGQRLGVLFAEADLSKPKLSATHSMIPAGPYDGIGGQHGFPRWADYEVESLTDGPDGEKRFAFGAKRSDDGIAPIKTFELTGSSLTIHTQISNPGTQPEDTSLGEHMYFPLVDENFEGLKVNGNSLDGLLGAGSLQTLRNGDTLYFDFGGSAAIDFPAGHSIRLTAGFEGETKYPLAMWIWKRGGSPSICFEPLVGAEREGDDNAGVHLGASGTATLTTKIELL